jgi:hypothetical protein
LYIPVALNCWVNPKGTVEVAGVTAIEVNTTATPVPESFTFCGVSLASSFTLRSPVSAPATAGEKKTENAHCVPGRERASAGISWHEEATCSNDAGDIQGLLRRVAQHDRPRAL